VCIAVAVQVADRLPNAPAVLVTAGDEGAAYCCRSTKGEHTGFVPVFKVDVADTTGAGDAFTAGFVYKVRREGAAVLQECGIAVHFVLCLSGLCSKRSG
jgi:fructokinase